MLADLFRVMNPFRRRFASEQHPWKKEEGVFAEHNDRLVHHFSLAHYGRYTIGRKGLAQEILLSARYFAQ
jgi:hypothetical protein